MILDRYFTRRFLQAFGLIAGIFFALIMLIDLIEQLRRFEGMRLGLGKLLHLSLLNAPAAMSELLPLIMILSAVVLFVGLARSSELVVSRAIGRSGIRSLAAPVTVAAVIGLLAVMLLNPIVAATSNRYDQLSAQARGTGASSSVLSVSGEGLWLRQGSQSGQSVIHADGHDPDATVLYGVTILSYSPNGVPVRRILAESARLEDDSWTLTNAKVWPLSAGINPEADSSVHATMSIATTLTHERIRETLGRVESVSIYNLPDTIRQLDEAGFSTRRQRVWYQVALARPLFLVAMVLVGAAFTMRHTRFGGTGVAVLTAVLLGFALYFIRNFAQILGENGQLPITLAAWAPPLAAVFLSLGLLLHAEDG
ncbi:LPS export ABC transporter permease LptG [Pseudodonghicola xiamenensis]|uniref:LPS export ABC transporter permease LptG n=1 Tax=Pseudodonghicola xiamenensis TaxID=337702 RepID=A0A8J3H339_9RHOB|nr:LPS export ABC transporter permease LptG [Pseudodonghicola xiamenensis]GHG80255.1 LPS export ABC transporter permease LptG [Pseudodonghicola xiamenensis]